MDDDARAQRIEEMLTRLVRFLDRWEPVLDRMAARNPAARFFTGGKRGDQG